MRALVLAALAAGLIGSGPGASVRTGTYAGDSGVRLTVDEALALAFPECKIERQTVYLTAEQLEKAEKLAGEEIDKKIVRPYVALREGKLVGTAYFDAHKVRTKRETVMFALNGEGRITRIELLAFAEPADYIPRSKWYAQFVGRKLDDELRLKRGIRGVTGATLTARATTSAARRVLAMHAAVQSEPQPVGRGQ